MTEGNPASDELPEIASVHFSLYPGGLTYHLSSTTELICETAESHDGKQSRVGTTCFDEAEGAYDNCSLSFIASDRVLETRASRWITQ